MQPSRMVSDKMWRRVLVLVAAALAACNAAGGDGSGIAYHSEYAQNSKSSHPIIGGTKATAYPEVALVDLFKNGKTAGTCSGVVVAPKVVLTAGHCVHGFNGWRIITPFATPQTRITKSSLTTYTGDGITPHPNENDMGLLFVAEAFALQSFPLLGKEKLADGTMVVSVGRVRDGYVSDHDLSVGKAVSIADATAIGFPNDYQTQQVNEADDSGGPVMLPGVAPHTIVAVNAGIGYETQLLARLDRVAGWVSDQIASHGGPGESGAAGAAGSPDGGGQAAAGGGAGAGGLGGSAGTLIPDPAGSGGGPEGNAGTNDPGPAGSGGTNDPGAGGEGGQPDGIGGSGSSDPGAAGDDGTGSCVGVAETEPNDSSQPQPFYPAECGTISAPDDEDWFTFEVTGAGVHYRIEVVGGDAEVIGWKLLGQDYYEVTSQSATVMDNISEEEGTYYVAVWSPSGSTVDYSLTLQTGE